MYFPRSFFTTDLLDLWKIKKCERVTSRGKRQKRPQRENYFQSLVGVTTLHMLVKLSCPQAHNYLIVHMRRTQAQVTTPSTGHRHAHEKKTSIFKAVAKIAYLKRTGSVVLIALEFAVHRNYPRKLMSKTLEKGSSHLRKVDWTPDNVQAQIRGDNH